MRFGMWRLLPIAGVLWLVGCGTLQAPAPVARSTPPTDCKAAVGTDRYAELPGYLLAQPSGKTVCVPLLVTANQPPAGYSGDFYVDEFTDAKLKQRWAACKADKSCFERINAQMQRWLQVRWEWREIRKPTEGCVICSFGHGEPKGTWAQTRVRQALRRTIRSQMWRSAQNAEAADFDVAALAAYCVAAWPRMTPYRRGSQSNARRWQDSSLPARSC